MAAPTNVEVNYESLVSFTFPEAIDADERSCLVLLQHHGLEKFMSFKPAFLLEEAVAEFFKNLRRDPLSGAAMSTVTAINAGGNNVSFNIDVQAVAQSLYKLPSAGLSPLSLKSSAVEEVMAKHIISSKTTGTLSTSDFRPKAKALIKVMKSAILGMLGSHHQVSGPQQKILAALLSEDNQWNWEDVFLTTLFDISKHTKLRLGVKVSAFVLHACREEKITWSRTDPVYTSWIRMGTTKQQVAAVSKKKKKRSHRPTSSSLEDTEGRISVQVM